MSKLVAVLTAAAIVATAGCSKTSSGAISKSSSLYSSATPSSSPSIFVPIPHSPKPPATPSVAVPPTGPIPVVPPPSPPVSPEKISPTTKKFTDSAKTFSLSYPKTWAKTNKTPGTLELRLYDEPAPKQAAEVWVLRDTVSSGAATDEMVAAGVSELNALGVTQVVKKASVKTTLGGSPARFVTYSGKQSGSGDSVVVQQYAAIGGKTGVVLSLTASKKEAPAFSSVLSEIAVTFEFLKK